jgi:hypothetical protein
LVNASLDGRRVETADPSAAYLQAATEDSTEIPVNFEELAAEETRQLIEQGVLGPTQPRPISIPVVNSRVEYRARETAGAASSAVPAPKARCVALGASSWLARGTAPAVRVNERRPANWTRWKRLLERVEHRLKILDVAAALRARIADSAPPVTVDRSTQTEDVDLRPPPVLEEFDEVKRCFDGFLRTVNTAARGGRVAFRTAIVAGRTYSEASGFVQLVGLVVPALLYFLGTTPPAADVRLLH